MTILNNNVKSILIFTHYYRNKFFSVLMPVYIISTIIHSCFDQLRINFTTFIKQALFSPSIYLINLHNTINLAHKPKTGEEANGTSQKEE